MKKRMLALSALLLSLSTAAIGAGVTASADEVTDSTGFAQCEEYINIRSSADTSGDVVGKIYNNGYMEILDETEEGWYYIKSGNVEGYISADYVAVGEEAAEIAKSAGYKTAEVGAISLNIRQDKSVDSEVVAAAEEGEKLEVVADGDDWIKVVSSDGTYGYVSSDYVYTSTEYAKAETPEEEQARLDRQWLAYLAAQGESTEATASDNEPAYTEDSSSDYTPASETSVSEAETAPSASDTGAYVPETEPSVPEAETEYVPETEPYVPETETEYVPETEPYVPETETEYVPETEPYVPETETEYVPETEPYVPETETEYVPETEAPSDNTSSSTGQAVADYAVQFVGNPYVYGGSSLTSGTDCSGFTMSVYANFGISLPHYSGSQMGYGTAVDASSLQAGDLVFYGAGGSQHVAIYIGGGQIVHAANSNSGIVITDMYWPGTPTGYRRLV